MRRLLQKQNEHGKMSDMDFDEWLKIGLDAGFCGPVVCETHDGFPMSDEDWAIADVDGEPPCMHMIRLYSDEEHKKAIESAHSASVWRKPNEE
jgi:hypothetical protein